MLAAAVARERATLPRLHVAGGSRPLAPGYEYTGGMSVPMLSALLPTEMKPAGGLTGGLPSMRGAPDPSKSENPKGKPSPPNDHPVTKEQQAQWEAELAKVQTVIAESQKKNAESQRPAGQFSGAETAVIVTLTVLWVLSLGLVAAHPMFIGAFIVLFTVWLAELLAASLRPDQTQLHNAVQTATDWTWLVQTRVPPLSMLIYMVMGIVVSLAAPPCCGGKSCIDASSEDAASSSGKCSKPDDCADSSDVCVEGGKVVDSCSGRENLLLGGDHVCLCIKSDGKNYKCTKDGDCKKDATCSADGVCKAKCTKPDDCAGPLDVCVDESKKAVDSCGSGTCECNKSDGKVYRCTKDEECKAGAACSADGACEAKAKCSSIEKTAGFCTGGREYDAANADTACAASSCVTGTAADQEACCKDPSKAKCLTVEALIKGGTFSCETGKVYSAAKANAECAASPCKGLLGDDDAQTCCDTAVKCDTISGQAGFCGTGKVYDDTKKDAACTVAPCQGATTSGKADVSTCCKAAEVKAGATAAHFESRTPASYGCPMEYASQTLYALFLISALR